MVVALSDVLTVPDLALASYERALAPKRLVTLAGGHFDPYVDEFEKPHRQRSSGLPSTSRPSSRPAYRIKRPLDDDLPAAKRRP